MAYLSRQVGLAIVIDHHVECGQEDLKVHHQLAPFLESHSSANCRVLLPFLTTPFYLTPNV